VPSAYFTMSSVVAGSPFVALSAAGISAAVASGGGASAGAEQPTAPAAKRAKVNPRVVLAKDFFMGFLKAAKRDARSSRSRGNKPRKFWTDPFELAGG
jgi:hypothetical protein